MILVFTAVILFFTTYFWGIYRLNKMAQNKMAQSERP